MNESPLVSSSPEQHASPLQTHFNPTRPHRPRWLFWVLGGIAVLGLLCSSALIFGGIRLYQNSQSAATDAIKVVDQFMQDGVRKDATAGLQLFSSSVQGQQVTQAGIATLFTEHEAYFAKYTSVKQDSFGVTSGTSGFTASLTGVIAYDGRPDRKFTATLAKENGQWKLIGIQLLEEFGQ